MKESLADKIKKKMGTAVEKPAEKGVPSDTPKAKKKKNWPQTPEMRDARAEKKGRLPDESTVAATYNAAKQEWLATITVQGRSFTGTGSGLFGLLHWLDSQYRETLKEKP